MKTANIFVMTVAGLLLAGAALLKVQEMLTLCIPSWTEHGAWESYEFFLLQIPLEFALGVWMVSGVFRKASWIAGTLAYCGFIFVTLGKALAGAESCGCFGQIHVNPWITLFTIDIPFFLLLAIFRPRGEKLLPPPWPNVGHAIAVAVVVFGFMAVASPVMVAFRPACEKPQEWHAVKPVRPVQPMPEEIKPAEPVAEPQESAPVEPSLPVVKETEPEPQSAVVEPEPETPRWPWLADIDIADQLGQGLTVVLMYHHDCPTCAVMVPKYNDYYKRMGADEGLTFAFVAIPPYGKIGEGPVPADTVCPVGKLSDEKKWAIMSPYVVALIDGAFVRDWDQGTAPEPDKIMDEIFQSD